MPIRQPGEDRNNQQQQQQQQQQNGPGNDISYLKNIDDKLIEIIKNEVMDHTPPITWGDIAGLEFVKKTVKEIVIWPMMRPYGLLINYLYSINFWFYLKKKLFLLNKK